MRGHQKSQATRKGLFEAWPCVANIKLRPPSKGHFGPLPCVASINLKLHLKRALRTAALRGQHKIEVAFKGRFGHLPCAATINLALRGQHTSEAAFKQKRHSEPMPSVANINQKPYCHIANALRTVALRARHKSGAAFKKGPFEPLPCVASAKPTPQLKCTSICGPAWPT